MAEMKKEQVDVDDQQEKERYETSFDDLPDDAIMEIMTGLDFASCLKLRVNKRLNRLQLAVKKELRRIDIQIHPKRYAIRVKHSNTRSSFESSNFDQLSQGLHRLALNTQVDDITMKLHVVPNEEHCRIADALLNFEAKNCAFYESGNKGPDPLKLQHIDCQSIHAITQNLGKFHCDGLVCSSFTAQDLCIIRKNMVESGCKLRCFIMTLGEEMEKSFLEACFGVTIDDFAGPIQGRIYRSSDDSVEIYAHFPSLSVREFNIVYHLEGDFYTKMLLNGTKKTCCITFRKCEKEEAKQFAVEMRSRHKVQLNHLYREQ